MAKSKTDQLNDTHVKALEQFNRIQGTLHEEREQSKEDRRFCSIPGAQWEGDLSDQYENKPKFEVNKVHLSVIRIINDYRNNKIDAKFLSKKPSDDQMATLCNGMFRADQHDSEAEEAFDNAFEEAVQGGMGAFRLRNDYEDEYDEDNEYQRIRIEPIFDADVSVFFDLDAKRMDKADAKYAYVITSMTPEAYTDKFDEDPATWPTDIRSENFDWSTPDVVYVAEYYEVEEKAEMKVFFTTLMEEEEAYWLKDMTDDMWTEFMAKGYTETRRRKIKNRRVHKYVMSGGGVLEDCGCIAGKNIPVVPVYGKRWYVENVERCMGHVRLAKDAQRLKNMQLSKLGEISALSSVEKPILTPEQVEGHERMWADDNIKDYPYLLVNPITDVEGQVMPAGPIAYTKPASIPPALAALLQLTEEDMKEILGKQDQAEELKTHLSGSAVEMIHARLDMQSYIYMSNFAKALKRCGEVWLSMAKEIYIEDERDVKVMDSENSMNTKQIMVKKIGEGGEVEIQNNVEEADFDFITDIGPSSLTQRNSAHRRYRDMLQYTDNPQDKEMLMSLALYNMDEASETREYFRKKLVKMGAMPPTEQDQQEMQMNPDEPSPQDQFALGEAQRAEAEAANYRAQTVETIASAEYKKAQAAQIQFEIQEASKPAPMTDDGSNADRTIKEEELLLKARVEAEQIALKKRELDLRERELEMRMQQGD